MIPGSNLLAQALRLISAQCFQYYKFLSRTPNDIGQDVNTYAAPVNCKGSVQPVPREMIQKFGLDFQQNWITFYVSKGIIDIARDVAGDQIIFNGNSYQCVSETPWRRIDGWDAVLAVQVPNTQVFP